MGVHYLNTELGLITYFNDTALYDFITSFAGTSRKYLVYASTTTTDGDTFLNNIDPSDIYLAVTTRGETVSPDLINLFNSFFPNTTYREATANEIYPIYNNSNMFVKTKTEPYFNPFFDGTNEYQSTAGTDPNNGFIIGGIVINSTSNIADRLYVSFLVFNDDYTKVYNVQLASLYYSSGSVARDRYIQITRHPIAYSDGTGGGDLAFMELFKNANPDPTPPSPDTDPYGPGAGGPGYSGAGGGPGGAGGTGETGTGGLHDDTSDPIPTPNLPSSIVTGSGLFTAYNPSASQLANFANELWNADISSIGDLFRLLFGGDAFNAIIGLHLLPVQPDTSGTPNIMLGNWDSGAPAPKIVNQYKQVSFGSLMLPEYWGNSIDYSPYTRIQLALPYIGIVDVDTDDVLGSNNTLTYNIDVLSGAICATLHCVKGNLNSVIYQWSGSCAVSLPITGASFNAVLGAVAGIGAAAAGTFALASGPVGAAIGAVGSTLAGTGMLAGAAANTFGSMKGKVQKSGAFGANSGALGIMTPYFIITRPVQSVPETWQADKGYPSNISAQLGTLTGYTEVSEINLECSGTEAEKKEIIDLLKKGVLF